MGTTSNLSLPYPDPTDANDVPADMQALADALDPIIIPDTTFSAKGDILAATGSATPSAVTVGADGTVLKADSTAGAGVAWGQVDTADIATDAVNADKIVAGAVGNTEIRDAAATSVIGRSANSSGDVADISTTTNGHVLRRTGDVLGFGTIDNTFISDWAEAVQDTSSAMITGASHSAINVTYNDTNGTLAFAHADTSTASSVNNSGATVIQDVTIDGYGHVTGLASATLGASDVGALSTTADSSTAYTVTIGATGKFLRIKDTVNASHYVEFQTLDLNANRIITFPNNSGTVALTSDFSGASVSYASTAGSAGSAGYATTAGSASSASNADTVDNYHAASFWKIHVSGSAPGDTTALWIVP